MAAFLSILSSLLVGIVLVVAPWYPPIWEANWLLQMWPAARGIVLSGFTRGAVSGLGLVNLVLALRDVHARLTGGSWGSPDAG